MPKCGEFLAVGHEFGTFAHVCAIDAKDIVVGTGQQGIGGLVIRLVAIPHHDPLKADDGGFVIFRQRHIDASAFAIDATAEVDFVTGIFGTVAADEAGIGLCSSRSGEQPFVEGGRPGLVDAILGMGGRTPPPRPTSRTSMRRKVWYVS